MNLMGGSWRACLLALLSGPAVLGAGSVTAQDAGYQDLTSLSIEELAHIKVSSASRHLEDARKAPSAVTVITGDEIARYGWRTLADLLRSAPGFYTAYDHNYTWVGVRGFLESGDYNARFLLLIDGHRLNENVYDSGLVGTEFPLNLDLIERVEIVRGPSSSMYGTNAMLAVVNVITRQPKGDSTVEVAVDVSSFLGRSGRVTASLHRGRLGGLVSGSFSRNPVRRGCTFRNSTRQKQTMGSQNTSMGTRTARLLRIWNGGSCGWRACTAAGRR